MEHSRFFDCYCDQVQCLFDICDSFDNTDHQESWEHIIQSLQEFFDHNEFSTIKLLQEYLKIYSINYAFNGDYTLLHWFTALGDVTAVDYLINAGANVNAESLYGEGPLYFIFESEPDSETFYDLIVQFKLAGADFNAVSAHCSMHSLLKMVEDCDELIEIFEEVISNNHYHEII